MGIISASDFPPKHPVSACKVNSFFLAFEINFAFTLSHNSPEDFLTDHAFIVPDKTDIPAYTADLF
jgi:hypothetical protein